MFYLKTILELSKSPEILYAMENQKIKIIRHGMNNKEPKWKGFTDKIRFDKELLRVFTGEQPKDCFKDIKFILVFTAEESTSSLFRIAYRLKGKISKEQYIDKNKKKYDEIRLIDNGNKNEFYYDLEECSEVKLMEFYDRLVIDWGKAAQAWIQVKLNKEVLQIYPKGFVTPFISWENINLSHNELKKIINNPDGNRDWKSFLSSHDGVYVIQYEKTGQLYVGSAYATEGEKKGLWGRLEGYVRTGHNDNKDLKEIYKKDPNNVQSFRYSIHHIFAKGTKTKSQILYFENNLKKKLGTRDHGLNKN